jgi:hypothetical protein
MTKTLCALGLASILLTGVAPCGFAASGDGGDNGSQSVTGTQLGSQQVGRPAAGKNGATSGTYGMNNPTGTGYPPPTGMQNNPDAANPTIPSPSGGGNGNGGGAGNGGSGGAGGASR